MGNLANDDIVTCPFHGARFDIISGKKVKEPVLTPSQEMEPLPKTWQKYLEHAGQLMAHIKTYDQEIYETKIEGDTIKIKNTVTVVFSLVNIVLILNIYS
jgi:nitrite reductase/ring-hydroxylating ferredoxin subunit